MQKVRTLARYALIVAITMPLVSCAFFDQLSAMRTFKDANFLYGRGDYEAAIVEYQIVLDAVRADPEGELGQGMSIAYFYVANSYDSLFKPAFRGERENDSFLESAEEYYQLAADNIPNAEFQKLSMQYLVSVYGPDKINDPSRRSEMLQQMVLLEPDNPDNYFVLAALYEESGLATDAEMIFQAAVQLNENDPNGYLQLAGFYDRIGDFDSAIGQLQERARVEPDNPAAYYTISTFYWEKAFRDFRITQEQKAEYVVAGLDAADVAIGLNDRYVDALVYKNILLRMQAGMLVCEDTDDTECISEQEGLIAQAEELQNTARDIEAEARGAALAAATAAEGN